MGENPFPNPPFFNFKEPFVLISKGEVAGMRIKVEGGWAVISGNVSLISSNEVEVKVLDEEEEDKLLRISVKANDDTCKLGPREIHVVVSAGDLRRILEVAKELRVDGERM